jgi:NADH:ubiquinone reductase (H+-translocating)
MTKQAQAIEKNSGRRHVVIVGAGFGGLSATRALARTPVEITLIDRHNYHLFQPLLYQVATAGLSPSDIASPVRSIVRDQRNVRVVLGEVSGIDTARREVLVEGRRVPYDELVIATGAQHAYFGHDDWAKFAPGLKTIDDATYLRRRILLAFEKAETETDPAERRRLLNFVVVGGGATGVEMAGAIAELAKRALASDFRSIDPGNARIILVEAGSRLLPGFMPELSEEACRSLDKLGVEVRLGAAVTACDDAGVALGIPRTSVEHRPEPLAKGDNERIDARTVIWAAGVVASPAGRWLGAETDRAGRVKVNADLSMPGHANVFVIGDTALALWPDGRPLPGVAPVAKQQGHYVGSLIAARIRGATLPPFRYRDFGSLAAIGRKSAVVEMAGLRLTGFVAWLVWCVAHIYFLIGFRNRAIVAMNWGWNYLTFQRGTRLITGISGAQMEHATDGEGARRLPMRGAA